MHKCDSCGKLVTNDKDYMCPHCGAVSNKHCAHDTHLPDDKYFRASDYNTTATPHKSKTYDYEQAPKTESNEKFQIDDLANIKNAEDAKKVAKKALFETDNNGKRKFKPLSKIVVIIVIINLITGVLDGFSDLGDEIGTSVENLFGESYVVGEDELIHNFMATTTVNDVSYDETEDCLTIDLSEMYFSYNYTTDDDWDIVEEDWNESFTFPYGVFPTSFTADVSIFDSNEIADEDEYYSTLGDVITLKGVFSDEGVVKIYGLKYYLKDFSNKDVCIYFSNVMAESQNSATNEMLQYNISFPTSFVKLYTVGETKFVSVHWDDERVIEVPEMENEYQYTPEEYVENVQFGANEFESVDVSQNYTEMVTLVG